VTMFYHFLALVFFLIIIHSIHFLILIMSVVCVHIVVIVSELYDVRLPIQLILIKLLLDVFEFVVV
jgi:hypothetical protein